MPEIEYKFKDPWLKWHVLRGGAKHIKSGGSTGVDLDTLSNGTGQAYSEIFTIDPLPKGAEDEKWDKVQFSFIYQHVNWRAKSKLSDFGSVVVIIVDKNQKQFDKTLSFRKLLMHENASSGRFQGEFTASFHNLSPGEYRLFIGEMSKGDGEPLRLAVHSGDVFENVPDPILPSAPIKQLPEIRNNEPSHPNEETPTSREPRDYEPTPMNNGGEENIPCFAGGTIIETQQGPRMIEAIRKGDMVRTSQRGFQPVCWIGSQKLSAENLHKNPQLRPIRIRAGALSSHTPFADLTVSPQHRILIRSKPAQRMFGTNEILVAAKHLLEIEGIEIVWEQDDVVYFHFMFEQHEIVIANGAETESFYTGDQALQSVGEATFAEISQIFPELENGNPMLPAVPFVTGRRARQLVRRHVKNHLELVSCHQQAPKLA